MATSYIEICNLALSFVGGARITSFDGSSREAILCEANYDLGRRAVLEERDWTFAINRDTLNATADVPKYGFSYTFLLPNDSMRIIQVYNLNEGLDPNPRGTQYKVEDTYIYANDSTIDVRYIFDQINTKRFSPLFDQTLAAFIAKNIAVPLTKNNTLMQNMTALYDESLSRAAASNGLQGSREKLVRSTLENSRRLFTGDSR